MWSCDIIVDWADPQEEPDEDTMARVKVLYCRNLTLTVTEESLRELFERLVQQSCNEGSVTDLLLVLGTCINCPLHYAWIQY